MALIKIKQINNSAASSGDVITYNGTNNVWAAPPGATPLTTVTTFAGLPGSPSTNDQVFYVPFNSVMTYDGTHWVGPKITIPLFGREGTGNGDAWLQAIGRSSAFPSGGTTHGYTIPNITVGSGTSDWKIYNMSISTLNSVTGDMELHADATLNNPIFGTTGVATIPIVAATSATSDVTPTIVSAGSVIQCYFRRTAGGWKAWATTTTYSLVAAA